VRLTLIAVVARNGVIGQGDGLPWHLPEDMRFFKEATRGHAVVMGRKTWQSLPPRFRPLPGRRNVVVTRDAAFDAPGAECAGSLDQALQRLAAEDRVFVIGGAELYAQALQAADELMLTEIDRDFDGDRRFPPWDRSRFRELRRETHRAAPPNDFDFAFVTYRRHPS
jgi:dihydrofolate reductase